MVLTARELQGASYEGLLAAADVVVEPSLGGEPPAQLLLQSLACSRPVLALQGGPAAELLQPGAGWLVASRWGPCVGALPEEGGAADEEQGGEPRPPFFSRQAASQPGAEQRLAGLNFCREADPIALAVALQRVHAAGVEGRALKGVAAAALAKALAAQRSSEAVAEAAWRRVIAVAQSGRLA